MRVSEGVILCSLGTRDDNDDVGEVGGEGWVQYVDDCLVSSDSR